MEEKERQAKDRKLEDSVERNTMGMLKEGRDKALIGLLTRGWRQ